MIRAIVEISRWMYPAFALSGWLAPLVFLLSVLWEVFQKWL